MHARVSPTWTSVRSVRKGHHSDLVGQSDPGCLYFYGVACSCSSCEHPLGVYLGDGGAARGIAFTRDVKDGVFVELNAILFACRCFDSCFHQVR